MHLAPKHKHWTKVVMIHKANKPANTMPTMATILHVLLSMHVSQVLKESAVERAESTISRRKKLEPIYMLQDSGY